MLGFKGPRKMTVIIPGMTHDQKRVQIIPQDNADSILGNSEHLLRILPVTTSYCSLIIQHICVPMTRSSRRQLSLTFLSPFLMQLFTVRTRK